MLHSPKQCGTSAPIFGDLPTYTPFCDQTLVKYTDKVSIKLQLLKQSVNITVTIPVKENQLNYNYIKLNLV